MIATDHKRQGERKSTVYASDFFARNRAKYAYVNNGFEK